MPNAAVLQRESPVRVTIVTARAIRETRCAHRGIRTVGHAPHRHHDAANAHEKRRDPVS
jgi:hypothetical protein